MKLSDALVLDARIAGEVLERSIAGQVEYWAKLGRAVERFRLRRQWHCAANLLPTQSLSV